MVNALAPGSDRAAMRKTFDWLIVGAGFTGCVLAERIASQLDKKVLLIDRRNHIGGNAFDYYNDHGIYLHKYGPHIFHTNSKRVWDYLSAFTRWRLYKHRVLGLIDGRTVPIPFNLTSLHRLFEPSHATGLEEALLEEYSYDERVPLSSLRKHRNPGLREFADFVFEKVYYGYTLKQWGVGPDELDPSVTARVPLVIGHDDRYFQDIYQGIPESGYTKLFETITCHKNIDVILGADFAEVRAATSYGGIAYTGPIDELLEYCFGPLPYRSLRFEHVTHDQEFFQEVATVNYPNDFEFTRITELKHMTGQASGKTTITYEYPQPHNPLLNDPYYPIPGPENRDLHRRYVEEARRLDDRILFAGRLADYKYYNMDQAVARALTLFEKYICGR